MNDRSVSKDFFQKLGGYYLIPHELLHVLAYRLIGQQCHYKWGDYRVQSRGKQSQGERLFVLLFPGAVCWLLGLFFYSGWVLLAVAAQMPAERYFLEIPPWHLAFPAIASLFVLYSGTAYRDVRRALQILSGKDKP